MKYIKEYAFSALAILVASCSSDNDSIEPEAQKTPVASSNTMSFSASIASGEAGSKATRTYLYGDNDPYPVWSSGDQIKVLNTATGDAQLFSINSSDVGERTANFTGNIKVETGNNANNKFYAFYAGNVSASSGAPTIAQSGENITISGTIPSTQSTTPGFHPDLHFMTACTTGSAFSFKNAMSLLKISITENMMPGNSYQDFVIRRIRFKANKTSENIAGTFTATIADNGTIGDYTVTNGTNEITIGDGETELAVGDYYIAILPCDFSEGFTLAFEDELDYSTTKNNLKVYDRIKDTAFPVVKSEIINLGSYTAKECAKAAYVDLGITNSSGQKVLWGIQDVYDNAGEAITGTNSKTTESPLRESYYAWGENYVKSNQYKESYCQNYSWYYTYGLGTGSTESNTHQRSYKYGIGNGAANDAWNSSNRWQFDSGSMRGVLLKYNSYNMFAGSITDWNGGATDGLTELQVADDAAYQKTNGIMRIPSVDDFQALIDAYDAKKVDVIYVNSTSRGHLYKIMNTETNRMIYLNARGYMYSQNSTDNSVQGTTNTSPKGYYWSRTRNPEDTKSYQARSLKITNGKGSGSKVLSIEDDVPRCQGRLLRGVIYR